MGGERERCFKGEEVLVMELVDGEEEWEVDSILDSRFSRRQLQYLVHWKGFDSSEDTWEPAGNVANAPDHVKDFHLRYPSKPKPRNYRTS